MPDRSVVARAVAPTAALVDSLTVKDSGSLLDQLPQFNEGAVHVGGHRPGGVGDQPGDVTGATARPGAAGAGGGELGEPGGEHRRRVLGVIDHTGPHRSG
jgi:hypothetical protein